MKDDCEPLKLDEYRHLIHLDKAYSCPNPAPESEKEREDLVIKLLEYLYSESNQEIPMEKLSSYKVGRLKLYSLMTVRDPLPLPSWFHESFGSLLRRESTNQVVKIDNLQLISQIMPNSSYKAAKNTILWKGDITTLQCDAIVNAANKYLLGCFQPYHKCIDNAIHSVAGPMLREDCNTIIKRQGCYEGTGRAKITRAYNLPSKFVLHTVGPIYDSTTDKIPQKQIEELSNCYESCLNLARKIPQIRTLAFCSISTGAFGFPMEPATRIALKTVEQWMEIYPNAFDLIIFDVYSNRDFEIYKSLLEKW